MTTALMVLVALLMVAGVAGSVLPFMPGSPLILAGALIYALATDFTPVGPWHLGLLVVLTAAAYALDYIAGALGAKKLGGSGWAATGAVLGAIVGFFFGPLGIVLGPILGGVAFELVYRRELRQGLKSGVGVGLGLVFGVAAKLSIAVIMVGLFTFWVIRGS